MLRIGAMNLLLHDVTAPEQAWRDSLSADSDDDRCYTLVMANSPFTGSLDKGNVNKKILAYANTSKTELFFLAQFVRSLALGGRCADEKTVWACKNKLAENGTFDRLFDDFRAFLDNKGLSFNEGKIIDAVFVEASKQRNTKEENKQIEDGGGKELWNPEEGDSERDKARKKHKKFHKDVDARWTKKRGENHYGYKNHVKADKKTKLIEKYHTTDASVHDSNIIEPLIDEVKDKGQDLFLDAGYESKDDIVKKKGMNPIICEREHRKNPLTEEQKKNNRIKSKDRCRIEHIFGFIEGAMNGSLVRSIGMARAKAANAMTNLVYNIFRYVQINIFQPHLITCEG